MVGLMALKGLKKDKKLFQRYLKNACLGGEAVRGQMIVPLEQLKLVG